MGNNIALGRSLVLKENNYLHSVTNRFLDSIRDLSFNRKGYSNRGAALVTLQNSIAKLRSREEEFYDMFGCNNYKEFYEIVNQILVEELPIFSVLGSSDFIDYIMRKDIDVIGDFFSELYMRLENSPQYYEVFQEIGQYINTDLEKQDIFAIAATAKDAINITITNERKYIKTGVKRKKVNGVYENTNIINKNMMEKIRDWLSENTNYSNRVVDSVTFKQSVIDYLQRKGFVHLNSNVLKAIDKVIVCIENNMNFSAQSRSVISGNVGEFNALLWFELLNENFANGINKNGKKRKLPLNKIEYVGDQLSLQSNMRQSSVDIFLQEKFGIQVKNFNDAALDMGWADVKLQSEISLEGFLNKLNTDKDLYSYLTTNLLFLNQNGLNYGDDEESPLNLLIGRAAEAINMVGAIIDEYAENALHTKGVDIIDKKTGELTKESGNNYGNVFFMLRGHILVPISLMLQGIYDALKMQEDSGVVSTMPSGLGGIMTTRHSSNEVKNLALGSASLKNNQDINNHELYQRKIQSLGESDNNSDFYGGGILEYPDEMVEIGSTAGKMMQKNIRVQFSYKYNLDNLINLLETYV